MAKRCELCEKKMGIFEKTFKINTFGSFCSNCYEQEKYKIEERQRAKNQELEKIKLEQEKKKIEKERIEIEGFKLEFMLSFHSLSLLYKTLNSKASHFESYLRKKNNVNILHTLILEMYKKVGETKSLTTSYNILSDIATVKDLIDKVILYNKNYLKLALEFTECYIDNYYVDDCVLNLFLGKDFNQEQLYIILNEFIDDNLDNCNTREIYCFFGIYSYAFSFIKSIILFRNIDNFINNKEMYTMFSNLKNGANLDFIEISNKLFPIYKSYYSNTFNEIYNEHEFTIFIKILNSHLLTLGTRNIYINEISEFKSNMNKPVFQYSPNEYASIILDYEELLIEINNKEYFDWLQIPYDLNYKYINGAYKMLHEYILLNIGDKIPEPVFFDLLDDKDEDYWIILKNKHEEEKNARERERFLRGDLSKEKEQELDKFNFENIHNGYEFEHYLKNVFEKLGYIAVVTKASGDQGADLIIEKDSIKTVVQAKYYTNPVGNKAIQEVVSAIAFYKANKGMVVTNSIYTRSAIELAQANNIALIDGDELSNIRNEIIEKI